MKAKNLAQLGILTSITLLLEMLSSIIKPGMVPITLSLVPIVVGAALIGRRAGAWLGLVFAAVVIFSPGTALFWGINAAGTVVTVFAKGIAAGFLSACVYKGLEKKSPRLAVFAAAVTAPLVNTGVFVLGCHLFFLDALSGWAGSQNVTLYIIVSLVTVNFLIELAVNTVLAGAIVRLIQIRGREI